MVHVKTHVVARRNARGGRSAQEHLVAALGGEGHDVTAGAAGGAEDGEVHGHEMNLKDWTNQYSIEVNSNWTD